MTNDQNLEAVKNNLTVSASRINDAVSLALFHIGELSALLTNSFSDIDAEEVGVAKNELFTKAYFEARDRLIAPVTAQNGFFDTSPASNATNACLCAELCKRLCISAEVQGLPICPSMLITAEDAPENCIIAYMRSAAADSAYRIFSKALPDAAVMYPSDFSSVCEAVYDGSAGFCILPYETSDEGILSGFVRLIRKYELSPAMICSVKGERNITRFALLGRSQYACVTDAATLRRLAPENKSTPLAIQKNGIPLAAIDTGIDSEDPKNQFDEPTASVSPAISVDICAYRSSYLKVTFDRPKGDTFAKLFSAAAQLGYEILKSDSVPLSWDDGRYALEITFDISKNDPCPLLLYLSLELPECSNSSLYFSVE